MKGNEFEVGDIIKLQEEQGDFYVIERKANAVYVQHESGRGMYYQNNWLLKLATFKEHVELSKKELIGFKIKAQQAIIEERKAKIEQLRSLNAQTRENIRILKQKQKEVK